jgi:DNA-binding transcriptional LysR family regulator
VAVVVTPRMFDVAETLKRFQEEHPDVQVHAVAADVRNMADLVSDGDVDFAVTPRMHRMSRALRFEPLVSSPLALLCPAGHRLAGARDVDPRDVVDESIIDLPRGWQSRDLFDSVLEGQGLRRRVRLEIQDWLTVLSLVQRGTGISYGAAACIDRDVFDGVEVATLAGAPLWELGVVHRDDAPRGSAGRALLAAYLTQCRDEPTADRVEGAGIPSGGARPPR